MPKEKQELVFKAESFRKIPSPYKDEDDKGPQMYVAVVDVKNVPAELQDWMETNPREQNTRSNVATKIKKSLLGNLDFHLLNRGILLSAESCSFSNYDNTVRVVFTNPEVHGDVDGGHTFKIILENRDELDLGQQFVKLEILTGVDGFFEDLAEARNTSTQVSDESMDNLRGCFQFLKNELDKLPFGDRINYCENGLGDIEIGEVLAVLNMFNIDKYNGLSSVPVESYSSKKRCLRNYEKCYEEHEDGKNNPYLKMVPLFEKIFKCYDQLEEKARDYYTEAKPNGQYGGIKGVTPCKTSKGFKSKYYGTKIMYNSPTGFIYPIIGSLRALVSEKNGEYYWTKDPLKVLDKVGPDLILTTVDRSTSLGNNPQSVGKDSGNWKTLFMTVGYDAK